MTEVALQIVYHTLTGQIKFIMVCGRFKQINSTKRISSVFKFEFLGLHSFIVR